MDHLAGDHLPIALTLRCRFDEHAPATCLVEYDEGCVCWPDRLQALCAQHAQSGLSEMPGRLVAVLRAEGEAD